MDQAFYLNQLGIETWHLQENAETESLTDDQQEYSQVYYYTLGQPSSPRGALLACADLCNEAEQHLVNAIVAATQLEAHGGFLSIFNLCELPKTIKVLVVLGERLTNKKPLHCPCLLSYSPQQLLNQKELKAQTWRDLKKAMRLMMADA